MKGENQKHVCIVYFNGITCELVTSPQPFRGIHHSTLIFVSYLNISLLISSSKQKVVQRKTEFYFWEHFYEAHN